MARTKRVTKIIDVPSRPKPELDVEAGGMLAPTKGTIDPLAMIEERVRFYEDRIDKMVVELSQKPPGFDQEPVKDYGERVRAVQDRCRSARVVLTELRLIRAALRKKMLVAHGANPALV